MAGILIIAHAPFASSLRDCVTHIYGGMPARIGAIDVTPQSDPIAVVDAAHAEVARLREQNGVLVLTDFFGATPANIAGRLAALPDVRVLAGANLPMLVRAVCYRTCPLDTLVEKAMAGGIKGIQPVTPGMTTCCGMSDSCAPVACTGLAEALSSSTSSTSSSFGAEPHASTRHHNRQ